ncbi:phage tail length tape-measure protein [Corallococcus coralloides DSM 2259]|uniref:Phage tail length tape-measure protein n=1 Tax=Corallococcus coralloides (strain ATCC 25202 / DSM 2259 / NBRC 100086 / M2) TaxID=1144275 RepID=H8MSX7_CORCM|nr:transglycosylase SLT domain-containing protein [Corallococcus coralloides]AFE11108.1 phage tail length tape-measure protein [Corallococcus coralloides DSM 2259]
MVPAPGSARLASFRVPSQDFASRPDAVSGARVQGGSCQKPGSGSVSSFQQDGFSAGPAKGAQWKQFAEGIEDMAKQLQQLVQLLQTQLGGAAASAGGAAGAQAPSCVSGASNAGGAPAAGDSFQAGSAQSAGAAGDIPKGEVGDWIKQAMDILKANGVPVDKMNPQDIAKIIQHESSGNPNAINLWDQNAKDGHPSIGLMQTIQPTFDAFKLPGHDNIRNPVDNIIAAVRYAVDRYGSVSNTPGIQAMNSGSGYVGY